MALNDFKQVYVNTYQEIFQKVLVAKKIASMRLQAGLKFGESVTRTIVDISGVEVRDITILTDRTIDDISDSEELLTINYNKGTTFRLSTKEVIQAGPLNPMAVVGAKVAHKTAEAVDADVFAEVSNATRAFDAGDLTTLASTGASIGLDATTVPQMVSRMPAKLRANDQVLTNMAFVVDPYAASDITHYLMGKQIDNSLSVFKNGYSGAISSGAEMYVSNNLTGEGVMGIATNPTADDTFSIQGVTWTFKATPSAAGEIDIGADADATRVLIAAAINNTNAYAAEAGAAAAYFEVTAANRLLLSGITAVDNVATADTVTVTGVGTGRLTLAETFTDGTDAWTHNFIHAYFGKKGAIELVMQEEVDMEMRDEPKQRTTNIFSEALYGVKTFADGAEMFLDVKISA
ncbi:hypothetical protein N8148_02775 [Gammaproteobacteria bacterium]|nr:hypothetical protein [Gammaproteobacteria bacterium]